MGISVYGAPEGSKNITISGNTITMSGNAGGLYAIDVQNYDANWGKGNGTTGLNISGNTVTVTGTGMVEPIYIASCADILVDGNKITSSSTGGDAYGIGTSTNNNFTVTNNEMDVLSENNMAYGVLVQSVSVSSMMLMWKLTATSLTLLVEIILPFQLMRNLVLAMLLFLTSQETPAL